VVGVAVEHEQRAVHLLSEVPVVGRALLGAVRRDVGAVDVEEQALGVAAVAALADVVRGQGIGRVGAGAGVDGVLESGERGLAGQVACGGGHPAADGLQQGIGAHSVGVVLVGVTAGDLKDALADQRRQGVANGTAALRGRAHRDRITTTFVAMAGDEPFGSASLVECDMSTHPDLGAVGSDLVRRAVRRSAELGAERG
jgi:hypothetical protein